MPKTPHVPDPDEREENSGDPGEWYIKEAAARQFERIVSETSEIYFSHMKQLAQSGSYNAAMQSALSAQSGATAIQAGASSAGLAVGGIVGGPGGAAVGGAFMSGVAAPFSGAMSYQAQLLMQQSTLQSISVDAAYYNRVAAEEMVKHLQGNVPHELPGVAISQAQAYMQAREINPFISHEDFATTLRNTRQPFAPFGSEGLALNLTGAQESLSSLYAQSMGESGSQFFENNDFWKVRPHTEEEDRDAWRARREREVGPGTGVGGFIEDVKRGASTAWRLFHGEGMGRIETEDYRATEQPHSTPGKLDPDKVLGMALLGDRDAVRAIQTLDPNSDASRSAVDIWKKFTLGGLQMASGETVAGTEQERIGQFLNTMHPGGNFGEARDTMREQQSELARAAEGAKVRRDVAQLAAEKNPLPENQLAFQKAENEYEKIVRQETAIRPEMAKFQRIADQVGEGGKTGIATFEGAAAAGMLRLETYGAGQGNQNIEAAFGNERKALSTERRSLETYQKDAPLTEQADLIRRIAELREKENQVLTQQIRTTAELTSTIVGYGAAAASAQQTTALLSGAGGRQGMALAQNTFEHSREATNSLFDQARAIYRDDVAHGQDPLKDPKYMQAGERAYQSQAQTTQAYMDQAKTPLSLGIRREESALQYQENLLQIMPGAYGDLRRTYRDELGNLAKQRSEVEQMRQDDFGKNGFNEAKDFEYQKRIQDIGAKQGEAFQKLSYGWESRLISETINAPGSFSMISPFLSYRAAVGAGVSNPAFGGKSTEDIFGFLRDGLQVSTLGATGTPAQFNATAMAGAAGAPGITPGSDGQLTGMPEVGQGPTVRQDRIVGREIVDQLGQYGRAQSEDAQGPAPLRMPIRMQEEFHPIVMPGRVQLTNPRQPQQPQEVREEYRGEDLRDPAFGRPRVVAPEIGLHAHMAPGTPESPQMQGAPLTPQARTQERSAAGPLLPGHEAPRPIHPFPGMAPLHIGERTPVTPETLYQHSPTVNTERPTDAFLESPRGNYAGSTGARDYSVQRLPLLPAVTGAGMSQPFADAPAYAYAPDPAGYQPLPEVPQVFQTPEAPQAPVRPAPPKRSSTGRPHPDVEETLPPGVAFTDYAHQMKPDGYLIGAFTPRPQKHKPERKTQEFGSIPVPLSTMEDQGTPLDIRVNSYAPPQVLPTFAENYRKAHPEQYQEALRVAARAFAPTSAPHADPHRSEAPDLPAGASDPYHAQTHGIETRRSEVQKRTPQTVVTPASDPYHALAHGIETRPVETRRPEPYQVVTPASDPYHTQTHGIEARIPLMKPQVDDRYIPAAEGHSPFQAPAPQAGHSAHFGNNVLSDDLAAQFAAEDEKKRLAQMSPAQRRDYGAPRHTYVQKPASPEILSTDLAAQFAAEDEKKQIAGMSAAQRREYGPARHAYTPKPPSPEILSADLAAQFAAEDQHKKLLGMSPAQRRDAHVVEHAYIPKPMPTDISSDGLIAQFKAEDARKLTPAQKRDQPLLQAPVQKQAPAQPQALRDPAFVPHGDHVVAPQLPPVSRNAPTPDTTPREQPKTVRHASVFADAPDHAIVDGSGNWAVITKRRTPEQSAPQALMDPAFGKPAAPAPAPAGAAAPPVSAALAAPSYGALPPTGPGMTPGHIGERIPLSDHGHGMRSPGMQAVAHAPLEETPRYQNPGVMQTPAVHVHLNNVVIELRMPDGSMVSAQGRVRTSESTQIDGGAQLSQPYGRAMGRGPNDR